VQKYLHAIKRGALWCFVIIFAAINQVMACPNCKEGFDKGTEQAGVGAAYSLTIGLLLLVPIAVVATVALKIKQGMKTHAHRS
jgi:hypothetical protein